KEKIHENEKRATAKRAAEFITTNDSVIIGSGTTTQFFAREIMPQVHLTVVTSALIVTLELLKHPNIEVIQFGASVRQTSSSVTQQYAIHTLNQFFSSKLFLGVDGIVLAYGISTTSA